MATSDELTALASTFRSAAEGLPGFAKTISTLLATNAVADIEGRVRRDGLRADGQDIGDYSPGYLSYKKRIGRYKGHVDLDLTGRMWSNTGITEQRVEGGGSFYVAIAGRSDETQKKLDDNAERFEFDPLALSESETAELVQDFDDELQLYLQSKGL